MRNLYKKDFKRFLNPRNPNWPFKFNFLLQITLFLVILWKNEIQQLLVYKYNFKQTIRFINLPSFFKRVKTIKTLNQVSFISEM